jgi:hypothetical protein
MTASAALTAVPSTETFGLPAQTPRLIAKLRALSLTDPTLFASIRAAGKEEL